MKANEISDICSGIKFADLSPAIVEMGKLCLLDFLGAASAGYQTRSALIGLKAARWFGKGEECTVIGSSHSMSPMGAAYANGTLGSALDIDDGHRGAVGHPGVMIFPATLAVGEIKSVSGADFIAAVVTGYELAIRCGMVMNSNHEKRFYGSGGWAVFGSGAAAGRLLGLTGQKLQNAITIGEVYGPTAQCGKSIAYGAMTKESIGWGAATGVFSAFLAQEGFVGPGEILLDEDDYASGSKDAFSDFGKKYEILNIYFKQYASCRWSHSPITAALKIKERDHPNVSDIKEIRVETFKKALTLDHKSPESSEAAQYSIPFTVANAFIHGDVGSKQVSEKNLNHPDIKDLTEKIKLIYAADLEPLFPKVRPARVIVEMTDGKIYQEEVHLMPGDPENPLSRHDLINKFTRCTADVIDQKSRDKILETVFSLECLTDIRALTGLLKFDKDLINNN